MITRRPNTRTAWTDGQVAWFRALRRGTPYEDSDRALADELTRLGCRISARAFHARQTGDPDAGT